MKPHFYGKWLVVAIFFGLHVGAQAQQAWRPFRPGLIYSYETPGTTTGGSYINAGLYTLRLDSAYVTAAGDSAWAFNRVMREVTGMGPGESAARQFRRSRNNLFGQRLLWQPGSKEYTLETTTEGSSQIGAALRLRPQAAVASTWVASATLGINAMLTSRTLQVVNGETDTVATITLSTGPVVRLSRRFGLLEGPQWLTLSGSPRQWLATQLPVPLAQSQYSPLRLFDLQPGDEIGYLNDQIILSGYACSSQRFLQRITSRIQTVDSLIFTYRTQIRDEFFGYQGCLPAGIVDNPVMAGRWAIALRTGKSNQFSYLPMLAGEYRITGLNGVDVSRGIVQLLPGNGGCLGDQLLVYDRIFRYGSSDIFGPAPDAYSQKSFSPTLGLGKLSDSGIHVIYYRRTRGGMTQTCGSPLSFANLLPTRAAQAAALATLHPNPATDAATLTLAQPARAGQRLRLTDALGRTIWRTAVPVGQTTAAVPLAGQPAGLYLLHLEGGATSASWKLTHE